MLYGRVLRGAATAAADLRNELSLGEQTNSNLQYPFSYEKICTVVSYSLIYWMEYDTGNWVEGYRGDFARTDNRVESLAYLDLIIYLHTILQFGAKCT